MSKKSDALNEFYRSQLVDLDLVVEEDGKVSFKSDGDVMPLMIANERVTLPLRNVIKDPDLKGIALYHPLSEQFSTALPPILNGLKGYIQLNLTMKYMAGIVGIAELLADTSRHSKLTSKVGKIVKNFGNIDDKSVKSIGSLLGKISSAPEKRLVNILMTPAEDGALRSTIITSPIVDLMREALDNNEIEVHGVKFRRKDFAQVVELFELVVGSKDGSSKQVFNSSDRIAAYYDSLMMGFKACAEHWNYLHGLFSKVAPIFKEAGSYSLEWGDAVEDFANFASTHASIVPTANTSRPAGDMIESLKRRTLSGEGISKDEEAPVSRRSTRREEEEDEGPRRRSISEFGNGRYDDDRYERRR